MSDDDAPHFEELESPGPRTLKSASRAEIHASARFRTADGFEVLLAPSVLRDTFRWAQSCAPHEGYALLAGQRFVDETGEYVVVDGFVADDEAIATTATVQTTPRSEMLTRQRLAASFPASEPIGWLHVHPGYGAFFSDTDRRNQSTWREPYQVGIVIDPVRGDIAVFRGPSSERMLEVTVGKAPATSASARANARASGLKRSGDLRDGHDTQQPTFVDRASGRPASTMRRLVGIVRELVAPLALAMVVGGVVVGGAALGTFLRELRHRLAAIEEHLGVPAVRTTNDPTSGDRSVEPHEAHSRPPVASRLAVCTDGADDDRSVNVSVAGR